jgi:hypothetical protein
LPVFEARRENYEKHTLPAMATLNGSALHLEFRDPPHVRLKKTFKHMMECPNPPLKRRFARKALGRVQNPEHPIHEEIRKILYPQAPVLAA